MWFLSYLTSRKYCLNSGTSKSHTLLSTIFSELLVTVLLLDVQLELVSVFELLAALLAGQPLPVVLHVQVQLEGLLRLERLLALRALVVCGRPVYGHVKGFVDGRVGDGFPSGVVPRLRHLIGVVNGGLLLRAFV